VLGGFGLFLHHRLPAEARVRLPSLIVARALSRTRSLWLLAILLFGSIVGRDAALLHQILLIRDYASATAFDESEASAVTKPPPNGKVRPSGLSKRSAWSPTDPPDDDDENDDDSDTVAARFVSIEPLPQPIVLAAVILDCAPPFVATRTTPPSFDLISALARGPPRPTQLAL
jgi:hypothetical protein